MNIFTPDLFARFNESGVLSFRTVDSSRGEDDLRHTALVEYPDGTPSRPRTTASPPRSA